MCFCFPVILGKTSVQIANFLPSTLSLFSPMTPLNTALNLMPCSQPSWRAMTLEAIPKRGKTVWVPQFSFLSKQNVSNPGCALSQPRIPIELAVLAVSRTITVCPFVIGSQIFIIWRHSSFPCLGGADKKMKTYLSHKKPTDIRIYSNGILLVIWLAPSGTLAKLFPRADSTGAAKF